MERHAAKIAIASASLMVIPLLGACSNDSADSTPATVTVSATPTVHSTSVPAGTPQGEELSILKPKVAWREALATAKREADGEPVSIRLSHDNRLVYEIELVSGDRETSIDIDATSGTVFGRDVDDDDGDASEVIDLNGIIEPDRAIAVATKAAPGRVVEWTIERDDGRVVYEVEVQTAGGDVDVIVDAKTAAVIEVDD